MTTVINLLVSTKCEKNLFTSWATTASQALFCEEHSTNQSLPQRVLSLWSLPRRWCEGNPGRTAHRSKQTLSWGCEVDIWWMRVSSWVHIHKVGPVITWNTHKMFNHLQNHHYIRLIFLIHLHRWETELLVTSTLN